jgi:hypothetical protein
MRSALTYSEGAANHQRFGPLSRARPGSVGLLPWADPRGSRRTERGRQATRAARRIRDRGAGQPGRGRGVPPGEAAPGRCGRGQGEVHGSAGGGANEGVCGDGQARGRVRPGRRGLGVCLRPPCPRARGVPRATGGVRRLPRLRAGSRLPVPLVWRFRSIGHGTPNYLLQQNSHAKHGSAPTTFPSGRFTWTTVNGFVNVFVKKSAKTPARELKVARERMKEVQGNDDA